MVIHPRLCNIRPVFSLLAVLALAFPAHAAEEDIAFKGRYEARFIGVLFGKAGIEFTQEGDHYTATSDVISSALTNLFARHSSHTTVTGTLPGDAHYETHYQTRKKKRHVKLVYEGGKITEQLVEPKDTSRPPVAADRKTGSVDPLTLLLRVRREAMKSLGGDNSTFQLHLYDGRRLTQVDGRLGDRRVLKLGKESIPVVEVILRRKLLAGFSPSELEDYDPDEPSLVMFFSDDERFWPLKLELAFSFGTLTVTRVRECGDEGACLYGLKAE